MYRFAGSKLSSPFIDTTTTNYTYGKVNGAILADIDNNGFVDIVTFPSVFDAPIPKAPVVWSNSGGSIAVANSLLETNGLAVQYFRDSVKGDFNQDGYTDFFQMDQGWELDGRNPEFFYGNHPTLFLGAASGLVYVPETQWMTTPTTKTFNHIGAAADFDRDGDLDLLVAGFWDFRLYRNDGNVRFTWLEDALPRNYLSDPSRTPGVANSPEKSVSGATFIKLGDEYAIIAGFYRSQSIDDPSGRRPIEVLKLSDGSFKVVAELNRPDLGGREINYGATDMYNIDLNADGREDLVVHWETEALGGVDDGSSTIVDGSYAGHTTRYADLSDQLVTVYLQNANGDLEPTSRAFNMAGVGLGHVYFDDVNRDGYIDFWNTSYGLELSNLHKAVWLGDGQGNFANPAADFFSFDEPTDQSWTPYLIDANNDGALDVIAIRPFFGDDYYYRNIGEQAAVFLNQISASSNRYLAGVSSNFDVSLDEHGIVNVSGSGLDLRMAAVERLSFNDASVAFDAEGIAGQAYRLYKAAFDRLPDTRGLGYWIAAMDQGATLDQVAAGFVGSTEFQSTYGVGISDTDFVTLLYANVLDRAPDASGFEYWLTKMADGMTREQVLANFSESTENKTNVADIIANGIYFNEFLP